MTNKKAITVLENAIKSLEEADIICRDMSNLRMKFGIKTIEEMSSYIKIYGDRMAQLMKADRDGRCVVLPCKIGTKIKTKNREETVNCFIIGQTRSGEIRMFGPGKANITGDFDEDFPDDDMKSAEIWYVRIDEE